VEYAQLQAEVRRRVRRPPSEYFQRQCWITLEPAEAMLDRVVADVGAPRIVFRADFPPLDHGLRMGGTMIAQRGPPGDDALREILWESPCRLMGVDPGDPSVERELEHPRREGGRELGSGGEEHAHGRGRGLAHELAEQLERRRIGPM